MASAVCSRLLSGSACTVSSASVSAKSYSRSSLNSVFVPQQWKSSAGKCRLRSKRACGVVRMGLRAVESYDASFQLQPECDERLRGLLKSETFCFQVAQQADKGPDVLYEFTGELFQPVPWSPATKHGMPQEYEKYLEDKEQYAIINIPPNFMFQAKIFKPSRLCAIYKRVGYEK